MSLTPEEKTELSMIRAAFPYLKALREAALDNHNILNNQWLETKKRFEHLDRRLATEDGRLKVLKAQNSAPAKLLEIPKDLADIFTDPIKLERALEILMTSHTKAKEEPNDAA